MKHTPAGKDKNAAGQNGLGQTADCSDQYLRVRSRIVTLGERWWTKPPLGQVSYLADVDPALLSLGFDPLPAGAPAIIRFRPAPGQRVGQYVNAFLDALDRAVLELFPRWLPGAEHLDGPTKLGIAAVRALAAGVAARSDHFGPFLAATAERALRDDLAAGRSRFPAEVRARGLALIVADVYGRESVALHTDVPNGLTPDGERALAAAAEWLAQHGRFTVWLTGTPLRSVDRIPSVRITLPVYLTRLAAEAGPRPGPVAAAGPGPVAAAPPVLTYPPLSGQPRADSAAEQALERALAPHEWARGRRWNEVLDWHLLGKEYRLDLFWPTDGLVVEVDGDDHRERLKYASDRQRDARLQLLGKDVLRFTNDQVLTDPAATAYVIRDLLLLRRRPLRQK
ncbi:Very-short-patch-repair endonuclease [Asanoa ishikariensis]|uniref:Very-short-patch-repair endonuclease n=1 Tax=Asanoa ishikariensis TaxID=137265 RepID=A0A1H3T4U7_9ACTN|nr:Very-short-patch-repair endonuclease [Asanoa ishikariensis]